MNTKQIAVIAFALVLGGCKTPSVATGEGGQKPPEITTDVVKRQDLTGYTFFDGKLVIPDTAKAIAFSPYDAPVMTVMTGTGKLVQRGTPIVRLTLAGAESASDSAKAGVDSAKADYSAQKADNSDPVRQSRRVLADARAAEKAAKDTVANGGEADVETATKDRVDAELALKQDLRDRNQTLQPAKDAMGNAAATLNDAKADERKGIIRAPITGTVVTLEAEPGLAAKSKQTLATIVNFEKVRVQGSVPAELKDLIAAGSHVIVLMSGASSAPLDGVVTGVTVMPPTEGQKGNGYLAVIKFTKPREMVKPSLSIKRIGVKTGTAKGVLVVPIGAITTKDGLSTVKVKSGDQWIETTVVVGITDGALAEIKSGLTEGATVRVVTPVEETERK